MNKYKITEIDSKYSTTSFVFYTPGKSIKNLEEYLCKRFKINKKFAELRSDLSLWYFGDKVLQLKDISNELR